jgi:ribosome-associated protein
MPSTESYQLLLAAAAACEDKKAEDVRILALDPSESGLTDYFLICNGTNQRQNIAITDEIELRLKRDFGVYPNSIEGRRQAEWILMDYVDFIVHVFSPEKRAFYGLERLRKSATTISVAALSAELKAKITSARTKKKVSRKVPVVSAKASSPAPLKGSRPKAAPSKAAPRKTSGGKAAPAVTKSAAKTVEGRKGAAKNAAKKAVRAAKT